MPSGLPWGSASCVRRHLRPAANYVVDLTETMANAWHRRLFLNAPHPSDDARVDDLAAMRRLTGVRWAFRNTHNGRYQGFVIQCDTCDRCCRVAWNLNFSTHAHMQEQRAILCVVSCTFHRHQQVWQSQCLLSDSAIFPKTLSNLRMLPWMHWAY